jgi:hypothetical protein
MIMIVVLAAILVASYFDGKNAADDAIDEEIRKIQVERMQPPG